MAHFVPLTGLPSASKLAQVFIQEIFRLNGLPEEIISDRGVQFIAKFWRSLCLALQVKLKHGEAFTKEERPSETEEERPNETQEERPSETEEERPNEIEERKVWWDRRRKAGDGSPSMMHIFTWIALFCGRELSTQETHGTGKLFIPVRRKNAVFRTDGRGSEDQVTSVGKTFVTAFLQNQDVKEMPQREIVVTGTSPNTTVTFTIMNSNFSKVLKIGKHESVTIPITSIDELKGTALSPHAVQITADADVIVMSRNYRNNIGDMTLIYPVHQLGFEYFIITPQKGPENQYKEFLLVSYEKPTTVDIYLKGTINYRTNSLKGDKMTLNLEPFNIIQIQSKNDLSGTKVVSQHPVAVITGHTCAENKIGCNHVYEQLRPAESWGSSFFIPNLSFQTNHDNVLVMASQHTSIQYQSCEKKVSKNVEAGEMVQINVCSSSPLTIDSNSGVQVLLYSTSRTSNNKPIGSCLTIIQANESFGIIYNLIGQNTFDSNLAVFTIKTSSVPGVTFDGKSPTDIEWKNVPGSEYSYAEYDYGSGFSFHTIQHPTTPFGLLSIGYSKNMTYGFVAPCIKENIDDLVHSNDELVACKFACRAKV
ncbi:IgGFc-binding protein-like [Pseudophryne corroboree]|uniref:IgGFc-binding protein-like n=1 Tax=Pseudophryne corroboree TaxID=495146 RepID=UPI003081F40E